MHNGNVLVLDVVDHHFTHFGLSQEVSVPEEEEIPTLEGWFHGSGKDDDYGGWRVSDDGEAFPHLCCVRSMLFKCARRALPTIKAVDKISAKFMTCAAACRGFPKLESILTNESDWFEREIERGRIRVARQLKERQRWFQSSSLMLASLDAPVRTGHGGLQETHRPVGKLIAHLLSIRVINPTSISRGRGEVAQFCDGGTI